MLAAHVRGAPCDDRLAVLLVAGAEARVVLVHVELAVEPEVVRVRAQEALDVGLGRERVEALLLERAQVAGPDLRRLLELAELELLAETGFPQAVANLEHRTIVVPITPS